MRQAHHSGENESLKRDRETVMEVYESVPRHALTRHFEENERTDERSPEIDYGPLDCWDTVARTCEIPENQGGIVARVLRDALQDREKEPQVRHCPEDGSDAAVETFEIQPGAARYSMDVGDMMANTWEDKPIVHQQHLGSTTMLPSLRTPWERFLRRGSCK